MTHQVTELLTELKQNFVCRNRTCRDHHSNITNLYETFREEIALYISGTLIRGRINLMSAQLLFTTGMRGHFGKGTRGVGKQGAHLDDLSKEIFYAILDVETQPNRN